MKKHASFLVLSAVAVLSLGCEAEVPTTPQTTPGAATDPGPQGDRAAANKGQKKSMADKKAMAPPKLRKDL